MLWKKPKRLVPKIMVQLHQYWLKLETAIAAVFYIGAASLLFADVVSRELFSQPIWGAVRSAVFLANGAALIGISIAVATGAHLRPNLLDNLFTGAAKERLIRAGYLLSAMVMFSGTVLGVQLVLGNREMGFTAPPLDFPIWIAQLALPYGFASAGLRYLLLTFHPEIAVKETIQ